MTALTVEETVALGQAVWAAMCDRESALDAPYVEIDDTSVLFDGRFDVPPDLADTLRAKRPDLTERPPR